MLAAIIGVVVLSGGGESTAPTSPPAGCLERWNSDPAALIYGRHNYIGHHYTSAQVRLLSESGENPRGGGGHCAVVFPSTSLDPEPFAAAEIHLDGRWRSLAKLPEIPDARLAELQVEAQSVANADLGADGTLASAEP